MEDILEKDLRGAGFADEPLKCYQTKNPLLHIIRELRHFEIHLHTGQLSSANKTALWGDRAKLEEASPIEIHVWMISDLTEEEFSQLRNARRYSQDETRRLLSWFNMAQREWGVNDLVFRATEAYCREIAQAYALL
jgi:hypothetical protein